MLPINKKVNSLSYSSKMATAAVRDAFFMIDDPIHGHVEYPMYVEGLIKTSEYQRLSNLKQLGASQKVFSSGHHTRFEHCLG